MPLRFFWSMHLLVLYPETFCLKEATDFMLWCWKTWIQDKRNVGIWCQQFTLINTQVLCCVTRLQQGYFGFISWCSAALILFIILQRIHSVVLLGVNRKNSHISESVWLCWGFGWTFNRLVLPLHNTSLTDNLHQACCLKLNNTGMIKFNVDAFY